MPDVADTDPVEVPALTVASPVVLATDKPNWVSRSPSEIPPAGRAGSCPKTPCNAVYTGVPAWMSWVRAVPAPMVKEATDPEEPAFGRPLPSTVAWADPQPSPAETYVSSGGGIAGEAQVCARF